MFDDINEKQSIFLKKVLLGSMGVCIIITLIILFGPGFGGPNGEGNVFVGLLTVGGGVTAGVFYCILRYEELEDED